ncbi:hypothetical protein PoB_002862700 [Plakobranchus ocellatus]|uniref:Uncharacterized protein n=1 Tax=Plakobranchus ocellatus TaxID=259542 RepID=A0AAV4A4A3_9GAST|nr:hypothetical protein PoB_002862700 [Plakobranchus ocellatus]
MSAVRKMFQTNLHTYWIHMQLRQGLKVGSVASERTSIICIDFAGVCFSLERTLTLDKGLEAWDHLIVGGQFVPTASTSSLSVSVDHRKHPLPSTSCHTGAIEKSLQVMTSRAWQLWFHVCNLVARVGATHGISITTGAVRGKPCTNVYLLSFGRSASAVCLSTKVSRQEDIFCSRLSTISQTYIWISLRTRRYE